MWVCVCVCTSVCLCVDLSSDQWIYPKYLQDRKKHQREKLGVQATDKALSTDAGDGVRRSLRKCSHKQVFACFSCNCKAQAAEILCNKLRVLLVCLFVCFLSAP